MRARDVFTQNNGDVTRAYYKAMEARGIQGELAVALFRAQKRSSAAKRYGKSKFKHSAYEVKNWSLSEICRILTKLNAAGCDFIRWGWERDPATKGYEHVLYLDLPVGQCSFHSADRLQGPDYSGKWNPGLGSERNIIAYCELVERVSTLDEIMAMEFEVQEAVHVPEPAENGDLFNGEVQG